MTDFQQFILIFIAVQLVILNFKIKFSKETDWKCESCVNYGCVANDSICDHCNGKNHYEYDAQKFRERKESEEE